MKKLVFLHGNPLNGQEFDPILPLLQKEGYNTIVHKRPLKGSKLEPLLQSINATVKVSGGGPFGLVAYSWGAYLALAYLHRFPENVTSVLLINPLLVDRKPISFVAKMMLSIPILRSIVLKFLNRKMVNEYINKTFYPKDPPEETRKQLQAFLSFSSIWRGAAVYKKLMLLKPLSKEFSSSQTPIIALFGAQDEVAPKSVQMEVLQNLNRVCFDTIANAGHALPWSHPDLIMEKIHQMGKIMNVETMRIGYQAGEQIRNNVIFYMEEHLRSFPERIALHWADPKGLTEWNREFSTPIPHQSINFKNFSSLIGRTAQGLLDLGIKKGDRVIIFLPMGLGMYTAMFAVQKIGAIAVFLDSWARAHHLGSSADCVQPTAMISHQAAFDLIESIPEFSSMKIRILAGPGSQEKYTTSLEKLMASPKEAPITPVASEFPALITFTTGSSGKPKGANRTHRFLSAQHEALNKVIPYLEADKDLPAFPIFSLNNLAAGVTTVMPALDLARPTPQDSALLACQIINEGVTCATLSPSMFNNLASYCKEKGIKLDHLRRIVTGGAPISRDDVAAFYLIAPKAEIWILYGSTEVEPMAHIEGREMLKFVKDPDPELVEEGVNVGHISEDLEYKFIHITPQPIDGQKTKWATLEVSKGEVGEFVVTGDHVCRDYYNNTEAFKKAKIVDQNGKVWHRTGDLAFEDESGALWIVGRIHNVIKRGERHYFPVRAEVILKRFPFIQQSAFLGMPDAELGEKNAVAVVLQPGFTDKTTAAQDISRVFEKNQIPLDSLYFIDKIPMDPRHHSKVEYAVLRDDLISKGVSDALA